MKIKTDGNCVIPNVLSIHIKQLNRKFESQGYTFGIKKIYIYIQKYS